MAVFQFNGYDLNDYFKLIKVSHEIGNERNITTDSAPKIGANIQQVAFGAKKIKLTVSLATRHLEDIAFVDPNEPAKVDNGMFYRVREQAARVLHSDKPVKLRLPDEPDRYYLAIVKGDVSLKGISDWYDQAEIEFMVPDGVAHSTTYRSFETPKTENGKLVFDLVNDGSVDAHPIITVKHNSENGYIGLVNSSGILELGDRQKGDTETYKQSEVLFDYASSNGQHRIPNGLSQGLKNVGITNDSNDPGPNGTLYIDNAWGRPHIALQSGQTASVTFDIPRDSSGVKGALYEYFWWRQIFWLGSADQMGYLKISVTDASGTFLYGVETYKRGSGLGCEYNFLASDGRGGYRFVDRKQFLGTHIEEHNPFNEPRGWSDIQRFDDVVQFYWWGSYPRYTIPEIKGKKSDKIHIIFSKIGNAPQVSHMYLDDFIYRKDYVVGVRKVPNRYRAGGEVVINSENDTVLVDNISKTVDVVQGSDFITIPPGKSQLEVYCSRWVTNRPSVSVKFEERYL